MPRKFQMDLMLKGAVEQYVSSFCMLEVAKQYPQPKLPTHEQHHAWHEKCEAAFETMFEEIMDSLSVTLKSPDWASIQLPLEERTLLKLEASYGK